MPEDHPLPAHHSPENSMPEEQPTPTNDPTSSGKVDAGPADSPRSEPEPVNAEPADTAEASPTAANEVIPEQQRPVEESSSDSPRQASEALGAASEATRSGQATAPNNDSRGRSGDRPKRDLVVKRSNKLALPQSLKRTGSVAKVAGSKILRDTGEGLVGFSEWLEGKTNEADVAEATAVQENLEERFEGTWQRWGGFLDQVKAPLPKKARRISNARLTGILVGILVFLFLALSSAISGPSSQAKDADTPLIRRPPQPPNSKLVQSRGSQAKSPSSSSSKTEKTSQDSASASPATKQSSGKKSVSAASFFGEESPRQAPPLNRPVSPRPSAATRTAAAPAQPRNSAAPPATAANVTAPPYPYGGYGVPGYPPPAYVQPPTGAAGEEAPNPGAYPPPYPYPPYFYPPPAGYPGSPDSSSPATAPVQPGAEGQQPSPYGGYAPYPYPYPYPPQATVPSSEGVPTPAQTAVPGKTDKAPAPATASASNSTSQSSASDSAAKK